MKRLAMVAVSLACMTYGVEVWAEDSDLSAKLAQCYKIYVNEDYDDAIICYKESLRIQETPAAYYSIASAHRTLNQCGEAMANARRAESMATPETQGHKIFELNANLISDIHANGCVEPDRTADAPEAPPIDAPSAPTLAAPEGPTQLGAMGKAGIICAAVGVLSFSSSLLAGARASAIRTELIETQLPDQPSADARVADFERARRTSQVLFFSGIGLVGAGVSVLSYDLLKRRDARVQVGAGVAPGAVRLRATWRF
ncbi:MAG: hypothetical protein AAGI01_00485 [Myxococcota bacterium]